MRILPVSSGVLVCFLVSLLFAVSSCHGNDKTVEVVGVGECADCAQNNIKNNQAFSGLRVTIDCKPENEEFFKTRGVGELDEEGKFKVSLPDEIVEDGSKLREECYAQLHSASATPCPAHDGLESSKIVFKTKANEKHTFGLAGKLKFSPVTCASAFFWPHLKYSSLPKFPPLPKLPHPKFKLPPWKNFHHPFPFPPKVFPPLPKKPLPPPVPKSLPPPAPKALPPPVPKSLPPPAPTKPLPPKPPVIKKPCPPIPKFKKPLPPIPKIFPPKPPVFKKPPPIPKVLPPPVPINKPKPPVPKVLPPPVPIYKPKPPVPKVLPPPFPIYKPKPPVPIYKPKPPVPKVLPPPGPIYKPKPHFFKPLPPFPKVPPFYKKPCPPLPKLPPIPKIPPKYFHHPKFGKWPPLPPFPSHP